MVSEVYEGHYMTVMECEARPRPLALQKESQDKTKVVRDVWTSHFSKREIWQRGGENTEQCTFIAVTTLFIFKIK